LEAVEEQVADLLEAVEAVLEGIEQAVLFYLQGHLIQ